MVNIDSVMMISSACLKLQGHNSCSVLCFAFAVVICISEVRCGSSWDLE